MQSDVRSGKKTDKYFRSPDFLIKDDKFIFYIKLILSSVIIQAFDIVRYPIQ